VAYKSPGGKILDLDFLDLYYLSEGEIKVDSWLLDKLSGLKDPHLKYVGTSKERGGRVHGFAMIEGEDKDKPCLVDLKNTLGYRYAVKRALHLVRHDSKEKAIKSLFVEVVETHRELLRAISKTEKPALQKL